MKRILIIILLLPLFALAQNDCGQKPVYKGKKFSSNYKSSKEYKAFKNNLTIWEECNNKFKNQLESDLNTYFDNSKLDDIEGVWLFSYNGKNYAKYGVKNNGYNYDIYYIERLSSMGSRQAIGEKMGELEQLAADNIFNAKFFTPYGTGTCVLKSGVMMECALNNYKVYALKSYPKSQNKKKKIRNGEWYGNGSGIVISKNGYIITNNHVIEDANEIEVELVSDGELQKYNAEVVQVDKTNDLAILKILDINFDGLNQISYNFKSRSSDVGTKVYAFGYPMALTIMGKEIKVTDGIISSKTGFDGDITTYQITAPIQEGNSGGPLFDDKGNLIGINSSGLRKDVADNVGYSIKTNYVLNLIDILPKSIDLPSSTKLSSLPLTEQIKEISKYVVLIKVK